MRDAGFDVRSKFRKAIGVAMWLKERVIAKSMLSRWGLGNLSFAGAAEDQFLSPRATESEHADKTSATIGLILELFQEKFIVGGIIAMFPGKAGGVNAGSSVKGIDLEAGVICQSPVTTEIPQAAGFDQGIGFKGIAIFNPLRKRGEFFLGKQGDAQRIL